MVTLLQGALSAAMIASCGGDAFQDRFDRLDPTQWTASDGWSNGAWFLNDWRKSQLRTGPAGMTVIVDRNPASKGGYSSGEIQSRKLFKYGYYEVRMTAASGSGLDTSFFTYTGPVHGQPWNEVDVEILGKDTRSVQFTYHTGDQQKATTVRLPFDSASESHTYGFDWQPAYIRWYVDGKLAHAESGTAALPLPSKPQQLLFSVANSNASPGWMGSFVWPGHPITAQVRCIARADHFAGAQLCK